MLENKKILIAEDQVDMCMFIKTILESSFDCEVDVAFDGEEALLLLKQNTYDLLITDFNMPKMNGINLIFALRDDLKNILPVILHTGDSLISIKSCINRFDNIYLSQKPFKVESFVQIVKSILSEAS